MTVFLKILQILLLLLGVLVVLLLLILFCPIHYQFFWERSIETVFVKGAVRWLFFLFYCPFRYEEEQWHIQFRVCGIQWNFWEGEEEKRKQTGRKKRAVKKERVRKQPVEREYSLERPTKEQESKTEPYALEAQEALEMERDSGEQETKKQKKRKLLSPRQMVSKIRRFRLRSTLRKLRGIGKKLVHHLSDIRVFWKEENTKQMVCIFKENVIHLLKKLKPKVMRGHLEIGTGDPCQTGLLLGGLSCLYAYYGEKIEIVPDFMERKFLGNLLVKGRISLITLLIILFRIMRSQEWDGFVKDVKNLKEDL